jgi:hypothetical protein
MSDVVPPGRYKCGPEEEACLISSYRSLLPMWAGKMLKLVEKNGQVAAKVNALFFMKDAFKCVPVPDCCVSLGVLTWLMSLSDRFRQWDAAKVKNKLDAMKTQFDNISRAIPALKELMNRSGLGRSALDVLMSL